VAAGRRKDTNGVQHTATARRENPKNVSSIK
jgi:hypothetical protein